MAGATFASAAIGTRRARGPNRESMRSLRGDIASPRLLVLKGALFVVLGLLASAGVLAAAMTGVSAWRLMLLHGVAVWGFCRAYYFAFYVIERYIDPTARYAGVLGAARDGWRVLRGGSITRSPAGGGES